MLNLRVCFSPGKPLAMMASKTIMATLLQHFRVEADGVLEDRKLRTDITVRFKDGYPVRLRKISL